VCECDSTSGARPPIDPAHSAARYRPHSGDTERTREIGIRKAVGAQRADIVGQFLLEATILSVAGGVLGIAVGVGVGSLSFAGFQLIVAPFSVVLAFVVSVAIGLFFGYPANQAAKLRPIDALRYE
jgi:putative ABC transport system permease protein